MSSDKMTDIRPKGCINKTRLMTRAPHGSYELKPFQNLPFTFFNFAIF